MKELKDKSPTEQDLQAAGSVLQIIPWSHHNLEGQLTECEKTSIEIHKDLCGKFNQTEAPTSYPEIIVR